MPNHISTSYFFKEKKRGGENHFFVKMGESVRSQENKKFIILAAAEISTFIFRSWQHNRDADVI